MDKKLRKTITITLFTILILALAITTAYFAISVSNSNNEKINAASSTVSIIYTDCASTKQSDCANMTKNLALGESFEKTFKVRNAGTVSTPYKIIFKELTNTFQNGDLVYTIKDLNDTVLQSERPVPYASSQITNVNAFLDTIAANTTKEFKIVVTLKLRETDQSVNSSANYSIKLGLTKQNGGTDNLYNLVADADPNSTGVITKSAPTGASCTNTLAYDGTVDNNIRYVGADPCNYVTFNEENAGWRIVGIMNNIDDGTGKKETRMKLIRSASLNTYSYHNSNTNNDWTQSVLMQELNGDYLDTTLTSNTMWYNGANANRAYDYTKGLKQSAQDLIGNALWNLGNITTSSYTVFSHTVKDFYTMEREANVYSGRATTWTGKVALVYPSDYGFAVGGTVRNQCLGVGWYETINDNSCYINNYIGQASRSNRQWTITQRNISNNYPFAIGQNITNSGAFYAATNYLALRPSMYLKSSVKITGGDGSSTNPYTLG